MSVTAVSAGRTICEMRGWSVSNLALQKILYLAHMFYLGRTGQPLIYENFEAWDYGPVVPELYQRAKAFGDGPVRNVFHWIPDVDEGRPEYAVLKEAVDSTANITPGRLVAITHWEKGAWADCYRPGPGLSLMVRTPDRDCVNPFRPPAATKQLGVSGEAIFTARRRRPETEMPHNGLRSNNEVRSCCHSSSAFFTADLARNVWPGCDMRGCKAAEAFDHICALIPAAIFRVERSPSRPVWT
jgi:uncharacterized phage-associated protein